MTKRLSGPIAASAAKAAPRAKSSGAKWVSKARLRPSTTPVLSAMSGRRARSYSLKSLRPADVAALGPAASRDSR